MIDRIPQWFEIGMLIDHRGAQISVQWRVTEPVIPRRFDGLTNTPYSATLSKAKGPGYRHWVSLSFDEAQGRKETKSCRLKQLDFDE